MGSVRQTRVVVMALLVMAAGLGVVALWHGRRAPERSLRETVSEAVPRPTPAPSATPSPTPSSTPAPTPALSQIPPPLEPAPSDPAGTGSLQGQVLLGGLGVSGGWLVLRREGSASETGQSTGPEGEFAFEDLAAGEYSLALVSPPSARPVRTFSLGQGEALTGLDFLLPGNPPLEGETRDAETGAPLGGVRILAESPPGAFPGFFSLENGFFRIPPLEDGAYEVRFDLAGFEARRLDLAIPDDLGAAPLRVELEPLPGVRVSGRVTDAGGQSVAGARVLAVPGAEAPAAYLENAHAVEAAAGGFFEMPHVPRAADGSLPFQVAAWAPGYVPAVSPEGAEASGGRVALRETLHLDTGRVLAGVVRDEAGSPVEGAAIDVEDVEPRLLALYRAFGAAPPGTASGAGGEFTLAGVPRGPVALSTTAPGFESQRTGVDEEAPASLEIVLRQREAGGSALAGRLVDERGLPLADHRILALCEACDLACRREAITDAQGAFAFDGAGECSLRLTSDGSVLRREAFFRVLAEHGMYGVEDFPVTLRIDLSHGLRLRVRDAAGGAVPRVESTVIAQGPIRMQRGEVLESASGEFRLSGLPRGPLTLVLRAQGAGSAVREGVRAEPGPSQILDLTLADGSLEDSSIAGRVEAGATGQRLADARVDLGMETPVGWQSIASTRTDEGGAFRFSAIPPGGWVLRVEKDGFLPREWELAEDALDLGSLALSPAATVTGTVRDGASGEPIAGAAVFVDGVAAFTDWRGRYRIEGLAQGEAEAYVSANRSTPRWRDSRTSITLEAGVENRFDFNLKD
ncbi:MAG: carboxypeptidase-like regulatory domain-containing protein [Sumerlaeia bacterium]